jgi:hypothetical protein
MHQIGASKTAYTRFCQPVLVSTITAKLLCASHCIRESIAREHARDATANNIDIMFKNKSPGTRREKRC